MGGHKPFLAGELGHDEYARKGNFGIVATSSTSELLLIRDLASVGETTFRRY